LLTTRLTRTNVVGIEKLLFLCLRVGFSHFFCEVRKRKDFVGIINDVAATIKSEFFFVVRNLISGRANPFELGGGNT